MIKIKKERKTIVVSAVNLTEGGTLTILKKCLDSLNKLNEDLTYKIIAFVYDKSWFDLSNIDFIEIKSAKRNWLRRLYTEYYFFNRYSRKIKPYLWISLHDITPHVYSEKRVVYCHNASPFYKIRFKDIYYSRKLVLFSLFYKYLYQINIRKNDYVIVQQNWLRKEFVQLYHLNNEKVIVANPNEEPVETVDMPGKNEVKNKPTFFFPSLSRPFKNFEIICKAAELLKDKGINNFKVYLTIDGSEDRYAREIVESYKKNKNIHFTGRLTYEDVLAKYNEVDCLIFPSRLETWGLPISEFARYNKPMIIADLPYAKETASSANYVSFFNPNDAEDLAKQMEWIINGDLTQFSPSPPLRIDPPYTQSWEELLKIIIE